MKTSEKEKLWRISVQDGRAKVFRNDIPLKSNNHNGQEYGFLLGVTVKEQSSDNKLIQLEFESQKESGNSSLKSALFKAKYFNKYKSSPPFDKCSSKNVKKLAEQLTHALDSLESSPRSEGVAGVATRAQDDHRQDVVEAPCTSSPAERISDSPKYVDAASTPRERSSPQHVDDTFADGEISESTAGPSQANETPVSTKQPLKRKTRLVFSAEDQNHAKKPKKEEELQRSCNECLVSATAHFIPIGNIELPTKVRQFRRVSEEFISSLEAEMERNPAGSYGALFVEAKEITNKDKWKLKDKDSYTYEVLGGTHLSLATKRMHEKQPSNPHFAGRMCRIYVGLSAEQAVYLGGMHQQSSMFQHEITYREEVEQCRMQLFGCADVSGDPPEPKSSWRDDCSCVLHKEKKGLSEVFAMARVAKDVWKEFQEVNSLCEKGSLKDQKVSAGEVMRGFVSLKQWHMKPLCSLSDEQKLYLLRKIKEKEISLKELKQEANNVRALSQVQGAIMIFFQLKSWEEAGTKFGNSVCTERLLRFRDVVQEVVDIVDMVISINFKRLMTIFNVIIICPVRASDLVAEALTTSGAAKTQQGFIVDTNRKRESKTKDLVMTEVVSSFVAGHWAVARQMVDRHMSRCTTNVILVQNKETNKQPKEVYEELITTFSQQGDLILDIGSGNGNGLLAGLSMKRQSVYVDQWTEENAPWHLLEDIKEQLLNFQ